MHGSPLLRTLLAFVVILLCGIPLWRITREAHAAPAASEPAKPAIAKAIHLQLESTLLPTSIRVLHLGEVVWRKENPGPGSDVELRIPFPQEGVDLQFEIAWPDDALAAMRVRLTDPEGREHEKSIWGRGETVEVLTFP
jgi:hypothetical protein